MISADQKLTRMFRVGERWSVKRCAELSHGAFRPLEIISNIVIRELRAYLLSARRIYDNLLAGTHTLERG